jgi:nucleotide-binding universal stress UspA family protein
MIGTVVIPLDGSDLGEKALPYAKAIAGRVGAPLVLLQVVPPDAPAPTVDEARAYLEQQAKPLGAGVEIDVPLGNPPEEIIAVAERHRDALIVMTTHGRSEIGKWLFGCVAERVVHASTVPVLLIRSGAAGPKMPPFQSILVPLDGSVLAEAVLPYAVQLAGAVNAEIQLVRVVGVGDAAGMLWMMPEVIEQLVRESDDYLSVVAKRLREEGRRVTTKTLIGFPATEILAYEQATRPDLVVMATHGRGGLNRLVFGSIAERVLQAGTAAVLMVRPHGAVMVETVP